MHFVLCLCSTCSRENRFVVEIPVFISPDELTADSGHALCPTCRSFVGLTESVIGPLTTREASGFKKGLWAFVHPEYPIPIEAFKEETARLWDRIQWSDAWLGHRAQLIGSRPLLRTWEGSDEGEFFLLFPCNSGSLYRRVAGEFVHNNGSPLAFSAETDHRPSLDIVGRYTEENTLVWGAS